MNVVTRIVIFAAVAVAVAFIGVTIAFFVVNVGDEELSPEAVRMLAPPQSPYAPEDNLYVALAGIQAPSGQTPGAAGAQRIAAYDRANALPTNERAAAHSEAEGGRSKRLEVSKGFDCRPGVRSCWSGVEARRAEHGEILKANEELHGRYLSLHATRGYVDIAKPGTVVLVPYPPQELRTLFLDDVALRVKDARTAPERSAALAELERDVRTWRAMLTGQGALISKFVAIYNLHGDYALLADMVGDARTPVAAHTREIEAMLSIVHADDWKITGAFDYEFRWIAALLDDFGREGSLLPGSRASGEKAPWWQSLVPGDLSGYFQGNATKNRGAQYFLEVKRAAAADGRDHAAEMEKVRRWRAEHLGPGWGYFQNPLGKFVLSLGTAYDEYLLRAHDAAGFHRLVRLGFEVRKQGVADTDMGAFIKQHAWAAHPVSGAPFAWDAAKRELVMTPLAEVNKERRFRIPVM